MSVSLVVSLVGWIAGWWLWGRPRRLGAITRGESSELGARRVTVVIPARDEASVLSGLLRDLLDQTVDVLVIVVDDHSTDGTAAVAREVIGDRSGQVVTAPPLPPGWVGKNWACHHGVRLAVEAGAVDDDVVVFLDADVRLAPAAVAEVVALVRPGRVVSVQPFHTTRRVYEQLSLFPGLVALGAIGAGRRGHPPSGVCGPLLAMTLADHRRVGGHASVRDQVVEDLALGARFVAVGIDTRVLLGEGEVSYRMYPAGPGQLAEGWTKNLASGAGAVPWWRTASTAVWISALGDAAIDVARLPFGAMGGRWQEPVLVYCAFVGQVALLGRRIGTFGIVTALLYPVALSAFVGLFARSVWRRTVRRSVVWRGRSVPTGGMRTPT